MQKNLSLSGMIRVAFVALLVAGLAVPAGADGGITFTDVAAGDGAGISYRRTPSERAQLRDDLIADLAINPVPIPDYFATTRPNSPQKGRGAPGVAILDYDGDGDQDIYVPNGPGTPNSLYSNQLAQTGNLTFVDVGVSAGVGATDQDSSGVCYGDIDNDGDPDLYVLGTGEGNRLFKNNGYGHFTDITAWAGVAGGDRHSIACSFGDVNGDGLLDVVVGNTYDDWDHRLAVFIVGPTYPGMEHNSLFINTGNNQFVDASAAAGIENVSNMAGPGLTGAAFTWAIAMADLNLDGAIDILSADNQGGAPQDPSEERGWNRYYQNDGAGNFTEVTQSVGLDEFGGYMGLAFSDFNCDGLLDFFVTDLGSYLTGAPSRWYFGQPDGTYEDPPLDPALVGNPFGWGTSAFDYDNDGDSDIVYGGTVDLLNAVVADNPQPVMLNTGVCSGVYVWDQAATSATDHVKRNVQGVVTGDLDDNGFFDVVSVSNFDIIEDVNWFDLILLTGPTGSPFDAVAKASNVLTGATVPGSVTPVDPLPEFPDGTLSVEISSGNANGWAKVDLVGSAGILRRGKVNRDGIGSTVFFTPDGGPTNIRQVLGGSSYASQDSLELGFGLGTARHGQLEVHWPGGIKNRLYYVGDGARVTFPHIPCSFDDDVRFGRYVRCVSKSLNRYRWKGEINFFEKIHLFTSALRAYIDSRA